MQGKKKQERKAIAQLLKEEEMQKECQFKPTLSKVSEIIASQIRLKNNLSNNNHINAINSNNVHDKLYM